MQCVCICKCATASSMRMYIHAHRCVGTLKIYAYRYIYMYIYMCLCVSVRDLKKPENIPRIIHVACEYSHAGRKKRNDPNNNTATLGEHST